MSGKIVGLIFDHYPGAGGGELLLAVKLGDNAHDDGTRIFPAVSTLATQTRQSERTVQYQLKRMVLLGWLELVRYANGGRGKAREYRIARTWIASHDSRIPEADRPTWTPRDPDAPPPAVPGKLCTKGANSAPFTAVDNCVANPLKGATAIAQKGATAIAPQPSLTVINTNTPLPPKGGQTESNFPNRHTGTTPPQYPAAIASAKAPCTHPGFESFKAAYPRWRSEGLARREWNSRKPSPEMQGQILAALAVQSQCDEWQREDGRYIPKPSVWLSRECWADQLQSTAITPHQSATPLPERVVLSPEQMAANRKRAGELLAQTRAALAARELQGVAA